MPDISSIGHGSFGPINRPTAPDASQRRAESADTIARRNDRVELSDHARLLDQLRDLPNVRRDLVQQIRDAIAQFLIPQEEWRQTTFRLDGREQLRQVKVTQTDVAGYSKLLVFGGVR